MYNKCIYKFIIFLFFFFLFKIHISQMDTIMTSKTQVMHNIFNKHNRSNIQLISKWNKHHLFSNPCLKLIFRHINVFFNFFEILYTFFFEKPHYQWFLKWYVCLQCNSGPRTSALFIFWPFSMMILTVWVNFFTYSAC